jgi:radical SAM protein with 4Fe4S-binding SPASM domain
MRGVILSDNGTISYNSERVGISERKKSYYPLRLLEVEITLRCPLRCIHCSVGGGESKVDLPLEKYLELVDDCYKLGVEGIDIIGGEPLAYPHIYEALSYTVKKIPKTYLSTAGYFINEKIADKLKSTGLEYVFISLDGPTKEKHEKIRGVGTFEKTLSAIRMLSEKGFYVIVSFVATSETFSDIPEMIELCEKLSAKKLFVLAFIPEGRGKRVSNLVLTEDMIKQVINFYIRYKGKVELEFDCSLKTYFGDLPSDCYICPAGTTFATVKVNGDVFPCGFLRDYENMKAGNIFEKRFIEIWCDDGNFSYFRKPISGCESCSIYKECRGGCQALKIGKVCDGKPYVRKQFFAELGFIK